MPTQRGRKSAAQLTVLTTLGGPRTAPKELTKSQAAIWRSITAAMPSEYFGPDTKPLLIAYVRHAATLDMLAIRIDAIECGQADDADYMSLLKQRSVESATLLRLAQTQRLTQLSRYKADSAKALPTTAAEADKPWQAAASH